MKHTHLFAFMGTLIVILAVGGFFIVQPILQKTQSLSASTSARLARATPSVLEDEKTASRAGVSIGPSGAKVSVVEFFDFQCPYSKAAHPTVMQLIKDYQNKSVRFIFRQLPITSIHPHAVSAASASLCANEQGKFLALYDIAYTRQEEISPAGLSVFARDLDLNLAQFNTCFAERRYEKDVTNDFSDGLALKIAGTPTWFINGERFEGALSLETFKEAIDRELGK